MQFRYIAFWVALLATACNSSAPQIEGGDTLWYEDGHIQFVSALQEDKLHGYLRKWAPDGSLVFEVQE